MDSIAQIAEPQLSMFDYQVVESSSSLPNPLLPDDDNSPGSLKLLQAANEIYRQTLWPVPFRSTRHDLRLSDARELNWLPNDSIDLIVTSPPYWSLKQYKPGNVGQMGDIDDYEEFLKELSRVFGESERVLKKGGRVCCVVGDICIPRKRGGRHYVMPLHADIQVMARDIGLDCLTPILWHKIANGVTEVAGNGAGFYGKPYQPGAVIKNDIEYILFLRKPGGYRSTSMLQKALSMLSREEMQLWMRSVWSDLPGSSTKNGHPAPYPTELAERLIRMFSFAGDTVLDPFVGTGSTSIAALNTGRNSIGSDIEIAYLEAAYEKLSTVSNQFRQVGAVRSSVCRIDY